MKSFHEWKLQQKLNQVTESTKLMDWVDENTALVTEATTASRYSVEVNFRTKMKETLEAYAKIVLGYVSAAMKQSGYHTKHVYDENPLRLLVSSRNWDDGEHTAIVYFHPEHEGGSFILATGFYNKEIKTVSMQNRTKCKGDSAAEITVELRNTMHKLKNTPDRHKEKLKGAPLKRGPKG